MSVIVSRMIQFSVRFRARRWEFSVTVPAPSTFSALYFFFFFNLLSALRGMWDLSSPTRDGTLGPCVGSTES